MVVDQASDEFHLVLNLSFLGSGFQQPLEIIENLENYEKSSMQGKIM